MEKQTKIEGFLSLSKPLRFCSHSLPPTQVLLPPTFLLPSPLPSFLPLLFLWTPHCLLSFSFSATLHFSLSSSLLSISTPTPPLPQSWLTTASAKTAYFHCVAQHRMGLVAQAGKNYGEAVARMKKAVELLGESEKKGEGVFKPYVRLLSFLYVSQ